MPQLKNYRREQFCGFVAAGANYTDAYLYAGYQPATREVQKSTASELAMVPEVAERIAEIRALISNSLVSRMWLNRDYVLKGLRENFERAMEAVEVLDRQGKRTGVYKWDGAVANRALELMGKALGMWIDRSESHVTIQRVEDIPDTVLDDAIRLGRQRLAEIEEKKRLELQATTVEVKALPDGVAEPDPGATPAGALAEPVDAEKLDRGLRQGQTE